jgi:hypothetical protein
MRRKMNLKAYRRNIRNACAALGNRIPDGYATQVAPNGDFIVVSRDAIVGRLAQYEPFFI